MNISKGLTSTGELELAWSFDHVDDGGFSLLYRVRNVAGSDVYVFDRLWTLAKDGKPVVDDEAIYRFDRAGSLRLLLGVAPVRRSVLYRNVPHLTKIPAGNARETMLSLKEPLTEYSCYAPRAVSDDQKPSPVQRVVLLVDYVLASADLEATPAPEDPSAFNLRKYGAGRGPQRLISEASAMSLEVLRRTDQFDRVTLPGEPQEPL